MFFLNFSLDFSSHFLDIRNNLKFGLHICTHSILFVFSMYKNKFVENFAKIIKILFASSWFRARVLLFVLYSILISQFLILHRVLVIKSSTFCSFCCCTQFDTFGDAFEASRACVCVSVLINVFVFYFYKVICLIYLVKNPGNIWLLH